MARNIVVGGDAGRLTSIAFTFLVKEARDYWIGHNRTYSHRRPESDTATFLDVYSDDQNIRNEARYALHFPKIYEPERIFDEYSVEQVVVNEHKETDLGEGRTAHALTGVVIFRRYDNAMRRLRIGTTWTQKNGNRWDTVEHCQDTK